MSAGGSFSSSTAAVTPTPTARRYTFLRRLAVGGMGELLLARASAPGGVQKLVAIKRVRPEYASDYEFTKMFLNEARLAASLDHPNVVRTYDLVEDAGTFFMVMEYLHGESLGRVLNTVVAAQQQVPLVHIVSLALGVSAGLHCAHERRGVDGHPLDIVHRDLSPGNIFVTYEGGVKLLDFGIAKATSRTSITIGPSRKGKVAYMSPEQCVGEDVDRRSDIFALGIVMWELCTGRRLFRGDNEFSIMNQITTTDAPWPTQFMPELPNDLVGIVMRALRRDRSERYQTAMELHDAIEVFAKAHGLLPSSAELGRYLEQTCGRRDYPSAEATEEFSNPARSTLVVPGTKDARAAPARRLPLVLAMAGGIALGGVAVGLSSSGFAEPSNAAPPREDATPAAVVAPERDGATRPATAAGGEPEAEPPADADADADVEAEAEADPAGNLAAAEASTTPTPPPAAEALADSDGDEPTADDPDAAAAPETSARPKKKKRRKKRSGSTDPSGVPVRGVDGILPSD